MSELKEKYIQFCCDFYNEHAPEDKIWFGRMFDDCHQEHNKRNSSMYRWQFPLKVLKEQEVKIDELQKINSTNQSTLQHFEHEYKKVIAERDALQKRVGELEHWNKNQYDLLKQQDLQLEGLNSLAMELEGIAKTLSVTEGRGAYYDSACRIKQALRGVNDINLPR